MCNINILVKRENTEKENINLNILSFLNSISAISYLANNHGEGIYLNSENKIYKQDKKLNLMKYINPIKESDFILLHERISTSGKTKEYHQPFQFGEFIILHNGMLSGFETGEKSDTYVFCENFLKCFENSKIKNRQKRIKSSISDTIKEIYGSFSIAIYDTIKKEIYYFKNRSTNIHFYKNEKYLFITTNKDNEDFLSLIGKFKEYDIEDGHIHLISKKKGKIVVTREEKIEEKEYPYQHQAYYNSCEYPTSYTPERFKGYPSQTISYDNPELVSKIEEKNDLKNELFQIEEDIKDFQEGTVEFITEEMDGFSEEEYFLQLNEDRRDVCRKLTNIGKEIKKLKKTSTQIITMGIKEDEEQFKTDGDLLREKKERELREYNNTIQNFNHKKIDYNKYPYGNEGYDYGYPC